MVNLNLVLEPHVGTPIVNRAEAEAARLYRKAKERAAMSRSSATSPMPMRACSMGQRTTGRSRRPELVVLVSHEIVTRGWDEVREGSMQDTRSRPRISCHRKEDRRRRLSHRVVLRRQGSPSHPPLDPQHIGRSPLAWSWDTHPSSTG